MLPVDEAENLHELHVEAELDASRRVLVARRRVLSLRAGFSDTSLEMRRARRRLALRQMALEIARDEVYSSDLLYQLVLTSERDDGRDYEAELAAERRRRREEHEELYHRLDDEVDPGYLTDPEEDIVHGIGHLFDYSDQEFEDYETDQDDSTHSGEENREDEENMQDDDDSDDSEDSDYVETVHTSAPASSPPRTRSRQ